MDHHPRSTEPAEEAVTRSGVRARSQELRLRAAGVCSECAISVGRSEALYAETARILASVPSSGTFRFFLLCGKVEDSPVWALWSRRRLVMTPALRARADVLVALGEQFASENSGPIAANLGEPLPALLTAVRACDEVRAVTFGPVAGSPSGPGAA